MKIKDITMIPLFTALIIAGAYIKIPVPVCPITLQVMFTTLAGVLLGGKKGAAAVGLYIVLGLIGLPVFTGGGGIWYVMQPTFGYIIGFMLGAYLTGIISHGGQPTMKRLVTACLAGLLVVYVLGIVYYWMISRFWLGSSIGIWTILTYCFLIPVPGDICLCVLTAVLGRRLLPVIKHMNAHSV